MNTIRYVAGGCVGSRRRIDRNDIWPMLSERMLRVHITAFCDTEGVLPHTDTNLTHVVVLSSGSDEAMQSLTYQRSAELFVE